jgi:hypothetical protein
MGEFTMSGPLTPDQCRRYQQEGILFPLPVLSADEVQFYRAACDDLETQLGGKPRTIEVRQMHLHFPWACALATHPAVLDAVESLLGSNLLIWATELFAKHGGDATVSIAWHRDKTYMRFDPATTTTAWIALGASTLENGCMRAIPGPARLAGQAAEDGAAARRRREPAAAVNEQDAVDVVLRPGEMSLHDADILHGSSANRSREKRVGFVIRFVTPAGYPLDGKPPVLRARGTDPCSNFRLVDPPSEAGRSGALAGMKQSAAQHLEAVLHNLKRPVERAGHLN